MGIVSNCREHDDIGIEFANPICASMEKYEAGISSAEGFSLIASNEPAVTNIFIFLNI